MRTWFRARVRAIVSFGVRVMAIVQVTVMVKVTCEGQDYRVTVSVTIMVDTVVTATIKATTRARISSGYVDR